MLDSGAFNSRNYLLCRPLLKNGCKIVKFVALKIASVVFSVVTGIFDAITSFFLSPISMGELDDFFKRHPFSGLLYKLGYAEFLRGLGITLFLPYQIKC